MRTMTAPADVPTLRLGWAWAPRLALFFLAYSAAAALAMGLSNNNTPMFWPPSGIYAGVLMLVPKRLWPAFIATAVLAEIAGDLLLYQLSVPASFGLAIANAADAVSAAYLVRWRHAEPLRFETLHQRIVRVLLAFALGPAVGAWIGAVTLTSVSGGEFAHHWLSWWIGDALGMLVFAPLTLLAVSSWRQQLRQLAAGRWLEFGVLMLLSSALFHTIFARQLPIGYASLLPLLWAALRFGLAGVVVLVAVLSLFACRYTLLGLGPFAYQVDAQLSTWMVELFVGVVGFSAIVVAALLQQRVDARKALQDAEAQARAELEQRVAARTAALRASEQRYRSLVMAANQSIWTVDASGHLSTIARPISGKSESELKGQGWLSMVHPDDMPGLAASWEAFKAAGISASLYEHEHRVRDASGAWRNVLVRGAPVLEDDGSVREWIGTTTDITERKQAEQSLRQSEQRYRTLVAATSHSVWIMDGQANMLMTTARISGRSAEQTLGRRWLEALYPEDRAEALRRLTGTHPPVAFDHQVRMKVAEETRIVLTRAAPVFDESGMLREWIGTSTDITERIRTEEALRLSEERYRTLVMASAQQSIWVLDAEGNMLTLENSVLKRSLDAATSDRKQWLQWVHPEDRVKAQRHFETMLRNRTACFGEGATLRMRAADETWRTVQIAAAPLLNADGSMREIIGRTVDITEQAQAQAALRISEERYRTLVTASQEAVWVLDAEGNMTALYKSAIDRDFSAMAGKGWLEWVHPEDRPAAWGRVESARRNLEPFHGQQRMLRADGVWRTIVVRGVPVLNCDGSLRELIGTSTDITEHKQAEDALRESEERYRTLVTASRQSVWALDPEGNMISMSNSVMEHSLADGAGKRWLEWLHPDDRAAAWEKCARALRTAEGYEGEQRVLGPGGTMRTVFVHAVPLCNADGTLRQLIGTTTDITQRKQAEAALRLSEERFRTLVTASQQGVWVIDLEGDMISLNNSVLKRSLADSTGKQWLQYVHPDDRMLVWERTMNAMRTGVSFDGEQRMLSVDGDYRWLLIHAVPVRNADGSVRELIGTSIDITERKRADDALRLSELRYRTLVTASQQSVWALDPEGNMIALSNSVLGRGLEECSGKRYFQWTHPEDAAAAREVLAKVLREPQPFQVELRVTAKDGSLRYLQSQGVPVLNTDGSLREFIGTSMDITKRKHAEMALRETAANLRRLAARQEELLEAERVRIAHDLHDGVGQLLNVAKLKLAAVDAGAKRAQVVEIAQIIDQTNAAIRTLEFELSPPVLRELGLVPALTWLADEMLRQYNLKVGISDDYQPIALDQLSRAVVFRAVRELLINVARHAGTNRAEVRARRLNDALELTIKDDGLGFAMNMDERGETRGLGLVGVRERIAAIGGSSEFHSVPGSGTVVVLRVPLALAAVGGRAIA